MSIDAPFAQMRTMEVLGILPILSKNSSSVVFLALGAFSSDPIAPSQRDIRNYTHLSRGSVSTALEYLCKGDLAHCFVDGDGVKRYRVDEKYFRYSGNSPVSVRELVPVSGHVAEEKEGSDQNFSPGDENLAASTVVVVDNLQSTELNRDKTTSTTSGAALKILRDAGIFSAFEDFSTAGVTEDQARAISEFIASNPKNKADPAGYAYRALKRDSHWKPVVYRQKSFGWFERNTKYVNR